MRCASFLARWLLAALAIVSTAACGAASSFDAGSGDVTRGDAAATDSPIGTNVMYPPPTCMGSDDEAPIPDGRGRHVCTYVGAVRTTSSGRWPDLTNEQAPFVYVRQGALGGDGSIGRPFGSIGEAFAGGVPMRTMVLAAG